MLETRPAERLPPDAVAPEPAEPLVVVVRIFLTGLVECSLLIYWVILTVHGERNEKCERTMRVYGPRAAAASSAALPLPDVGAAAFEGELAFLDAVRNVDGVLAVEARQAEPLSGGARRLHHRRKR